MGIIIAIDGPGGSGKGTITKIVAETLGLINVDTGAMYRCVALDCLNKNIGPNEEKKIAEILKDIDINLKREGEKQLVFLNGEDVTSKIREPRVDEAVAKYAAIKIVRDKVTPIQQKMGESGNIIMEGRDIGTVVFPNADIKLFLDCSIEERARRRYRQNLQRGIDIPYEEVLSGLIERNRLETEREIAPFVKAEDAIYLDSSNMSVDEEAQAVLKIIDEELKKQGKEI